MSPTLLAPSVRSSSVTAVHQGESLPGWDLEFMQMSHGQVQGQQEGDLLMAKNPIKIKAANKGKLHEELGVPEGQKISTEQLELAKASASPADSAEGMP